MDFSIPEKYLQDLKCFKAYVRTKLTPRLADWYQSGTIPRDFFHALGKGGWFCIATKKGHLAMGSALREALIAEELAKCSPGVAVAALVQIDLGLMGLYLFGTAGLHRKYGPNAAAGKTLMCLGNTENKAGSDVAGISTRAVRVDGGWVLNGAKAYVTNGLISDLAIITAVSDPQVAARGKPAAD